MKYINAEQILPKELIETIQSYIDGQYLYIPVFGDKKGWGENSGSKNQLEKRNSMIKKKAYQGYTIQALAREYYLSESSIRKIIK